MTFLEKYKQEHPDYQSNAEPFIYCPDDFDYEKPHPCDGMSCYDCWAREIPGTENKKEKKNMATKTKKELVEELKEACENIENLKKEIEKCERYKQYEECANEFAALRESFVNAGFSKDEAFMLVRDVFVSKVKSVLG